MSVHNTLLLTRKLREEKNKTFERKRTPRIVYENQSTKWDDLIKKYGIHEKNVSLFENIAHISDGWGASANIPVLRNAYTIDLMVNIAKNSWKDCESFIDIAKKTILFGSTLKYDHFFDRLLVIIAIGEQPSNFDYVAKIKNIAMKNENEKFNKTTKDTILNTCVQLYGLKAYQHICDLKLCDNDFQTKLFLHYINSDARVNTLIFPTLKHLYDNNLLKLDKDLIQEQIYPSKMFNYKIFQAMTLIDFSTLMVKKERYQADEKNIVSYSNESTTDTIKLIEFLNLVLCEKALLNFHNTPDKNFINEKKYSNISEVFNDFPIFEIWSLHSLESFINKNKTNKWDETSIVFDKIKLEKQIEQKIPHNDSSTVKQLKI